MAKKAKQQLRHGDPEQIDYVPLRDRENDRHLDDEELDHAEELIKRGVKLKLEGPEYKSLSDALFAEAEPYAAANTVIRTMYVPAVEMPAAQSRKLPIVVNDVKGARVTWQGVSYPVTDKWAEAFTALIEAKGKPIGLTRLVDHTRDAINWLDSNAPALRQLLRKGSGNSGYYLACFE